MADQPPQPEAVGLKAPVGAFRFLTRATVMCVVNHRAIVQPRLHDRLMVAQITLVGPGRTKGYYARKKKSGFLQRASVTPIARGNSTVALASTASDSLPPGPHHNLMSR